MNDKDIARVPLIYHEFTVIELERRLKRYRIIAVIETVALLTLAFYHYLLS